MPLPVTTQLLVPEIVPEIVLPLVGAFQDTVGAACALTAKTAATAALIVVTRIETPFSDLSWNCDDVFARPMPGMQTQRNQIVSCAQ
jgi:hypothetical protein